MTKLNKEEFNKEYNEQLNQERGKYVTDAINKAVKLAVEEHRNTAVIEISAVDSIILEKSLEYLVSTSTPEVTYTYEPLKITVNWPKFNEGN